MKEPVAPPGANHEGFPLRAVELFSGIGGFAAAAHAAGVEVVAAFDQSEAANEVYRANFPIAPRARNLEGIAATEIPPADLWWLSPPCKPFAGRGRKGDTADPRDLALLNVVGLVRECLPRALLLENVPGFARSRSRDLLLEALGAAGYAVREVELCPTLFGVPMKRERHFVAASRSGAIRAEPLPSLPLRPLAEFLDAAPLEELVLDPSEVERGGRGIRIVDPAAPDAILACVTSAYARSPVRSGSVLRASDGRLRRLSPDEVVRLLGFPPRFAWPPALPLRARHRLAGNSIDVRAASYLLRLVGAAGVAPHSLTTSSPS